MITTTATTTVDVTTEDYWDSGSGLYDADDAYTDDEDIGAGLDSFKKRIMDG